MINFTSCQSENADAGCAEIVAYLVRQTRLPMRFVADDDWRERRRRVDTGQIDVAWMCGLWYVKRRDDEGQPIDLLAAPVMLGEVYQNRPIYYSNLLVRSDSPAQSLADLQHGRFAINEPDSHSGCVVMGYHLAHSGLDWSHFSSVVVSGGHLTSLQMLLEGDIDAAAIDSTTLETALRLQPNLAGQTRTLALLGPSSIPPWTVRADLDPAINSLLNQALTTMHHTDEGAKILKQHGYQQFVTVLDNQYNDIRFMRQSAGASNVV